MNSSHSPFTHSSAGKPYARAQLSPLQLRVTQNATLRSRFGARPRAGAARRIWSSDTPTPATPVLAERWWNPHFLDRLQAPLTRIHE